ncbi:MAG: hypothetical protein PHI27_06225 [Eubacteriales bacterium]|nr:hypothetical protein [Eubacteriales bacterium]MDD3881830.1 hypothetical protein [Eubacteriales bacterium]MDD4512924.1 hypothetical protein [Eubacteriales bacterium]
MERKKSAKPVQKPVIKPLDAPEKTEAPESAESEEATYRSGEAKNECWNSGKY